MGVPHGYGKAYYSNGGYFQGYFKNGVADCVDGIFVYPDGTFYRGDIRDSSANGHGTLVYKNGEMIFYHFTIGQFLMVGKKVLQLIDKIMTEIMNLIIVILFQW